jgi:membrane-bound lytic murein transglycosylase B
MLNRRAFLTVPTVLVASQAYAAGGDFNAFLNGVRADARKQGVSEATLNRAFAGVHPNAKVLELDRYQPEFTQTWDHYRSVRLSDARISNGRAAYAQTRGILQAVQVRYGVDPDVIMGVWGLETNYGTFLGGYNVIEALATLAWDGRRAGYFRTELLAALKILEHGDVTPARMVGSYAGAMGQPQFMPTMYLKLAVDFDGTGKRDIWDDRGDALASIGNYLAKSGWRAGQRWGVQVRLPAGFDTSLAGRDRAQPIGAWTRMGVVRFDGGAIGNAAESAALIMPDGAGGEAFLAYPNFSVIRRYNPSDFYALSVGLLGDTVVA